MTRIPLICESLQGKGHHYDAPFLTAQVSIKDEVWRPALLVDTGAASTTFNGHKLAGIESIWSQGKDFDATGVGTWPATFFGEGILTIDLPEGPLPLKMPRVSVFYPYLHVRPDGRREGALAPTAPFQKSKRMPLGDYQACEAPNLLGRDVFRANGLSLAWNPLGDTYLEIRKTA